MRFLATLGINKTKYVTHIRFYLIESLTSLSALEMLFWPDETSFGIIFDDIFSADGLPVLISFHKFRNADGAKDDDRA